VNRVEGVDGDWSWAVRPDLGASIVRLDWRDKPILRRIEGQISSVLDTGCFPLVPFANRVGNGRFEFDGQVVHLPVLEAFTPHALHGDGWLAQWETAEGPAASTLVYAHDAGAWPWAYRARQTLAFYGDEAVVTLGLQNLSDRPMPWGLGLHPYFPAGPHTRLAFEARGVWENNEQGLPLRVSPAASVFDWASGPRVVEAPLIDHCYVGCGPARLIQPDLEVEIRPSANAGWGQVFAPGRGFVCFEPVTQRPDVFNARGEEQLSSVPIAPGAWRSMTMSLRVSAD
jgi:aldose 1-epimerase